MLAWAAGALVISIYKDCQLHLGIGGGGVGEEGGRGRGMCGNSAVAEVVFIGLSVGMIWKRCW
jgi:hypothetical protein